MFSLGVLWRLQMVWIRILRLCCVCFHQVLFLEDIGDNTFWVGDGKKVEWKGRKGETDLLVWLLLSYWAQRRVFFFFLTDCWVKCGYQSLLNKLFLHPYAKHCFAWRRSQLPCMYSPSSGSLPSSSLYFMSLHAPRGLPHSALPAVKGSSTAKATKTREKHTNRWSSLDLPPLLALALSP